MWSPPSHHAIVKSQDSKKIYKINRVVEKSSEKMEKVHIISSSTTANASIASGSIPRKIEQRSISFTGQIDHNKPGPSQDRHRRHSSANVPPPPTFPRSRSPIGKRYSLDSDKPQAQQRAGGGIVLMDPKPLPDWILKKDSQREKDRASATKRETSRRQRFNRTNSLGYEPRQHHRHGHQADRQAEFEAYFNGGGSGHHDF